MGGPQSSSENDGNEKIPNMHQIPNYMKMLLSLQLMYIVKYTT